MQGSRACLRMELSDSYGALHHLALATVRLVCVPDAGAQCFGALALPTLVTTARAGRCEQAVPKKGLLGTLLDTLHTLLDPLQLPHPVSAVWVCPSRARA